MSVPGKQLLEDRASPLASFQFSQLWAATMVGVTSSYFKQDCARHLKLGAVLCLLVAVLAFKAASKKRYRPLWWAVLAFSLLKNAILLQVAYHAKAMKALGPLLFSGSLPEVLVTLFKCYFNLPQMLMLDLHGAPLFCFILFNAGVGTVFNAAAAGRSLLQAVLHAVGIQAVCYFAFVYIRHSARRSSSQPTKGGPLKEVPEAPKVKQLPGRPAKEELENQRKGQQQQQQQQQRQLVEGSGHDEGEV